MNTDKVTYSITRSLDLFYSPSKKFKYEKISKNLERFYIEGIKDKESALELRNKVLAEYPYKNRYKFSDSLTSFISMMTSQNFFTQKFINFCNQHNKLKKFLNLE